MRVTPNFPMMRKTLCRIIFSVSAALAVSASLFGQKTLDHEIFLEKIANSGEAVYREAIREYNAYLDKFPNDLSVFIEKCKFIMYALYDDYEEYNPNQAELDSCLTLLTEKFPDHPDVLLFQVSYLYGEELEEVCTNAEISIEVSPEKWSSANLAELYKAMSDQYYYDSDYAEALTFMEKAISNNQEYEYSLEYARILVELERNTEAIRILKSARDTISEPWHLMQKANMLLELKAFSDALELYERIEQIDSMYIDNSTIAASLSGVGEYETARKYLAADTLYEWNRYSALRSLLAHDFQHGDGAQCLATYNAFRDLGYMVDPFGLYRLKLLFLHPFQPWSFRDFLPFIPLILLIVILIAVPYIWILPVYFIGHRKRWLSSKKSYPSPWGLKAFWIVSAGYLIASLFSFIAEPDGLYPIINSQHFYDDTAITEKSLGYIDLIFTSIMALLGAVAMYKVNPRILLSSKWVIGNSILVGLGAMLAFRIFSTLYVSGLLGLGVSIDDIATGLSNILLASRQDIEALISVCGNGGAFLLIGILAPLYEEIIFRGVILDSCQKYLNFTTANIFQSALFAAIHMSLYSFPLFFLFGMIAGLMRRESDGLLPGIVFHATNNIIVMLILFAI